VGYTVPPTAARPGAGAVCGGRERICKAAKGRLSGHAGPGHM